MKTKMIRALIGWLNRKYPYLVLEVVVGRGKHVARNPKRRPKVTAVVNLPQHTESTAGKDSEAWSK